VTSRRTSDPLAIVEAGYDLALDDDAWVARLTHVISRDLAGPLGTVGYGFQRELGFRYTVHNISVAGGDPILAHLTRGVVASFPLDDLGGFFRQRGVTTSTESCRTPMPAQGIERGLIEFCGVVVGDEERGVTIGAPLPDVTRPSLPARLRWRRIAAHLSAVFRLRNALSAGCIDNEEALLRPDARIVHATGSVARSRGARRALRDAVAAMEKARGPLRREDPPAALALWREIVAGRWTIVEKVESCGRRLLVAHANAPEAGRLRALSPTENIILRNVLDGHSAARIASTLGLTAGAVSRHVGRMLKKLRLRSASEIVTTAAWLRRSSHVSQLELGGVNALCVDTGPDAETFLAARLTNAERQVAGLVLDGLSTAEIAERRRCAYRTVANQLASVYGKLGVSSRVELGAYVAKVGGVAH
jgi:DNA-binding CsgD family transcriptional regulator